MINIPITDEIRQKCGFLIPDPIGVDKEIQNIQITLANGLTWLEKSFGRCQVQKEAVTPEEAVLRMGPAYGNFTREVIYPEVYSETREPINIMPNDFLKSYCFFQVKDPIDIKDFQFGDLQMSFEAPLSIIFWVNLEKINPDLNYRYTEQLKSAIFDKLKRVSSLRIVRVFESYDRVLEGFSITENCRQYLKPPFSAVRIDCTITYTEDCN